MVRLEDRIFINGGGEAMRESLKKVKPNKEPHRGLGIAELEKLRTEESKKRFPCDTELGFYPLHLQPNTAISFPMFRYQLLDSNPVVSSDGTMPLLWSSFQRDSFSSSSSQLSQFTSEMKQPPWEPQLLLPLQKHEFQQQISQMVNHSSLHSVPGAGLQMELELPSNQSIYGIVNASSWADQQIKLHQIVAMNHSLLFQMDAAQHQRVAIPEPIPISPSNCSTMVINRTQGKNTDCSINHPTVMMNGGSEEDVVRPVEGSTLSFVCLPSVCSSAGSKKTMPIRQSSEMIVTKKQKNEESSGSKTPATPSESLAFYNFMELPYNDYVADRDVIANHTGRRCEGSDAVDVDLKL